MCSFWSNVVFVIAGMVIATGFCVAGFTALEKEYLASQQKWAERCLQWGENPPKELQTYCEGLGL